MEVIGYARVSTPEQKLELQVDALTAYGCTKIFKEKQSGANSDREQLNNALNYMRSGDKLVVYKIDRLARSTFDLQRIARDLQERNITLVFIQEQIDFSTPTGKMMFVMLGAIAEFERDLINERSREGILRAQQQGKHMGRPARPTKDIERALALCEQRDDNGLSIRDIANMTGVPRSTIYAEMAKRKTPTD